VRVALSPEAVGKGAMVVMNGQINAAREVTKTNSIEREAFQSLEFGALGIADVCDVRFYRAPLRRQTVAYDPATPLPRIEIVMHYAGADGRVLDAMLADWDRFGCDGMVISATGVGNVSETTNVAREKRRAVHLRRFSLGLSPRPITSKAIAPAIGSKMMIVSMYSPISTCTAALAALAP
jgi:L-asparaginase